MIKNNSVGLPLKIVAHLIFVVGMLVFFIFPANEYEWMRQVDPSMSALPEDGSSGNRLVFTFLVLIVILIAQLILFVKTRKKSDKLVSAALMTAAIIFWTTKYYTA